MKILLAVSLLVLVVGMVVLVPDRVPAMCLTAAIFITFTLFLTWPDLIIPALLVALPLPKIIADIISLQPTGTVAELVRFQPGLTPGDFIICLAAAACLFRISRDRVMLARFRLSFRSGPGKPLIVFWLIAAVSLWGLDPESASTCFLYLIKLGEGFLCYFLAFILVRDARAWTRCFKTALSVAVLVACTALVMFAMGISVDPGGRRGLAPFFFTGGLSDFGSYLVLFVAAYLSLFLITFRKGHSTYRLMLLPLPMIICLLLLYERHLVIGLAAAMCSLVWLARGTMRLVFLGVIICLFSVGLAIVPETVTRAEETFERSGDTGGYYTDAISMGAPEALADLIENSQLDSSSRHRMLRWVTAATAFWNHPVLGVGFWADVMSGIGPSHSQYLKILAEMGLLGFASFVWLCWRLCKTVKWVSKEAQNPRVKALAWAVGATLVALFVQGFFALNISLIRLAPVLWLVIGLMAVSRHCFAGQPKQRAMNNSQWQEAVPVRPYSSIPLTTAYFGASLRSL